MKVLAPLRRVRLASDQQVAVLANRRLARALPVRPAERPKLGVLLNRCDGQAGHVRRSPLPLCGRHAGASTEDLALRLSRCQPRLGALGNHVPLELSERADNREYHLADCRGGVDVLRQAAKLRALLVKPVDDLHQLSEIAPKPIQGPDHKAVTFPKPSQAHFQFGPVLGDARNVLFVDRTRSNAVLGERVDLHGQILIVRRDPRVADQVPLFFHNKSVCPLFSCDNEYIGRQVGGQALYSDGQIDGRTEANMALRKIKRLIVDGDAAQTAEAHSSHFLADANAAAERGNNDKAERLYERSQEWLDEANRQRRWN